MTNLFNFYIKAFLGLFLGYFYFFILYYLQTQLEPNLQILKLFIVVDGIYRCLMYRSNKIIIGKVQSYHHVTDTATIVVDN